MLWALGLWAALRAGWSRRRLFAAAACVVVVLAVVRAVVFAVGAGTHHELYLYTWSRIDAPLVGALAGIAVAAGWLRRPPRWLVPAGAVALGVYVAFAFATPWDLGALPAGLHTGLAAVGAVTVVAVVTVPGSRLARALAWRPLVGLGVLSYSVYIWHCPLFLYFHRHKLRGPLAVGLAIVIALLVACLSYVAVERPSSVGVCGTACATSRSPATAIRLDAGGRVSAALRDAPAHRRPPPYLRRAPHIGARQPPAPFRPGGF